MTAETYYKQVLQEADGISVPSEHDEATTVFNGRLVVHSEDFHTDEVTFDHTDILVELFFDYGVLKVIVTVDDKETVIDGRSFETVIQSKLIVEV